MLSKSLSRRKSDQSLGGALFLDAGRPPLPRRSGDSRYLSSPLWRYLFAAEFTKVNTAFRLELLRLLG